MELSNKVEYYKRLTKKYNKNGGKFFIEQYLNADGNELKDKFWSKISSSRLAFELYSWLVNEDFVLDFEFEYKLKGINHSPKKPNMDVYIETRDELIFIESKYTEASTQNLNNLPRSYYLEEAKDTRGNKLKSTLEERYYGDKDSAYKIKKFIEDYVDKLNRVNSSRCWMDYSQEVKHLIGLFLFFQDPINNKKLNKDIYFYNIYYKSKEEVIDKNIDEFFKDAQCLFGDLIFPGKKEKFKYEYHTVQEVLNYIRERKPNAKAFGLDMSVSDKIKEEFNL